MQNIQNIGANSLLDRVLHYLSSLWVIFQPKSQNLPIYIGIASVFFLFLIALLVRKLLSIRRSLKETSVLLELTPPAITEKSAYTTDQLFSIIHSIGNQMSLRDRLLGYQARFSLAIVSTQNQGIRYLVRTSKKQANTLKKSLLSYLPHLRVRVVDEYLPDTNTLSKSFYKILEFKLSKHFAFSLRRQIELEMHDPIAYLTGQMTNYCQANKYLFNL